MAYIYGNRYQTTMFPESIEDYVSKDDPVRAYDAFVEALNLKELGVNIEEVKVGNPAYNPKAMIKLIVYGCSYGIRSSRKLERACNHNISFIWLMEGLKPDHKTIAEARRNYKEPLKNILKQCAKMCIKLDLVEGNTLFVDGSKIRANASINNTFTKQRAETLLIDIDKHIQQILDECDTADEKEQNDSSLVKVKAELKDTNQLKAKVEQIMKELTKTNKEKINSTDPECVNVHGRQGTHAGYNGQIVVDEKHGIIVNSDVVAACNDRNQFAEQIEQANKILETKCKNACADAGYTSIKELKKVDEQGINVIVPSQEQISHARENQFNKEYFKYDSNNDYYICPEGKILKHIKRDDNNNSDIYMILDKALCHTCKHFGVCTKSRDGRTIRCNFDEAIMKRLEANYEKQESQAIFRLRKQKVELPFGHMKRNLGINAFLLKGLAGVKAEMSIFSTCFNIARMITIFGVTGFIEKLATV